MEKSKFWPAWYYGPDGAADIFNSPSEVPEGWQAHPSKVKAGKETVHPGGEEAGSSDEDEDEDEDEDGDEGSDDEDDELPAATLPAYDDITKEDIVARLDATDGVTFNKAWNKERLYEVLKDTL